MVAPLGFEPRTSRLSVGTLAGRLIRPLLCRLSYGAAKQHRNRTMPTLKNSAGGYSEGRRQRGHGGMFVYCRCARQQEDSRPL